MVILLVKTLFSQINTLNINIKGPQKAFSSRYGMTSICPLLNLPSSTKLVVMFILRFHLQQYNLCSFSAQCSHSSQQLIPSKMASFTKLSFLISFSILFRFYQFRIFFLLSSFLLIFLSFFYTFLLIHWSFLSFFTCSFSIIAFCFHSFISFLSFILRSSIVFILFSFFFLAFYRFSFFIILFILFSLFLFFILSIQYFFYYFFLSFSISFQLSLYLSFFSTVSPFCPLSFFYYFISSTFFISSFLFCSFFLLFSFLKLFLFPSFYLVLFFPFQFYWSLLFFSLSLFPIKMFISFRSRPKPELRISYASTFDSQAICRLKQIASYCRLQIDSYYNLAQCHSVRVSLTRTGQQAHIISIRRTDNGLS